MPTPPPAPEKPDLSRDLDHNGIVDAADDRSRDLNHDGVIDGNDRQERDLNHDNVIDGTDQELQARQNVGASMGWSNEGGSWKPLENDESQKRKQEPKVD
jgi:hypothetical protein